MADLDARKVSARLAERLSVTGSDDVVEVVVEMRPLSVPREGSRRERADALKTAFEAELAPVAVRIAELGGQVVEAAWLNQTVRSRIPVRALAEVAADEAVVAIDLARPIAPD